MKTAYTFDDIQIVPQFSSIESRSTCKLNTKITKNYSIDIPIVSAPMDTVTEHEMAIALSMNGGIGCIHRFMTIENQSKEVFLSNHCIAAIGATGDFQERAKEMVNSGAKILLIDVAHGNTVQVMGAIEWCKLNLPSDIDIIAGNVATYEGAANLIAWGADAIRVGIGNGSLCETRIRTGIGVPQVTAIMECVKASEDFKKGIPIIADGGIKTAGDVAKALSLGASTVMLGSLLAGTRESPGEIQRVGFWPNEVLYKKYRGSASAEAKLANGQEAKNVEGNSKIIPYKGRVDRIINDICDGIRSAMSYTNSSILEELYFNSEHVIITQNGLVEAKPHLLI